MTMTRDKIAELLRQASATPDGYRMLVDVADVIALAERALEPQGQALPESCEMTPEQMTAYAQSVADRASQLVLPAGPVPEGVQPVGTVVLEWKETDYQEYDKVRAVEWFGPCSPPEGTLLYTGSPAVAQPEPDWSASKTLISEAWKNPLTPMGERLQIADGAVRFRDDVIANLRKQLAEAEAKAAVAQPVADEREGGAQ